MCEVCGMYIWLCHDNDTICVDVLWDLDHEAKGCNVPECRVV